MSAALKGPPHLLIEFSAALNGPPQLLIEAAPQSSWLQLGR